MSLIPLPSRWVGGVLLAIAGSFPALADEAEARALLSLEARADGKCQILSEGGKLVVLRSAATRAINYRLIRYFANVPQSPSVGRVSPEAPEQPLGCSRVDGREQRWIIKRASFEETKSP